MPVCVGGCCTCEYIRGSPVAKIMYGGKSPKWVLGTELDPLQGQSVLLPAAPSLSPQASYFSSSLRLQQ